MDVSDQPTIVLSGPLARRNQAAKMLANGGFEIAQGDPNHGHGLPDTTGGEEDKTVGWLTVHGENIDRAQELMNGLGWAIRRHWLGSKRVAPLLSELPQTVTEERVQQMIEQALSKKEGVDYR